MSSRRAPGMARAVARPPEGRTSRSAVPWMTSVGAVILASAAVRSPEARIAASWRLLPAPSPVARSKLRSMVARSVSSSRSKPGEPIRWKKRTTRSMAASRLRGRRSTK
jgi:hypothetical protein